MEARTLLTDGVSMGNPNHENGFSGARGAMPERITSGGAQRGPGQVGEKVGTAE